jgi:hypothetical protein
MAPGILTACRKAAKKNGENETQVTSDEESRISVISA